MNIRQTSYRTIWVKRGNRRIIQIIDQRFLPHRLVIKDLKTSNDVIQAIRDMQVRGAPLIGVSGAYGMYLAVLEVSRSRNMDAKIQKSARLLKAARPTAVNLEWAVEKVLTEIQNVSSVEDKIRRAFETANQMAAEDIQVCRKIGEHGLSLIEKISRRKKGKSVQIMTHCNAGWLACVDWGTATAPIYLAHRKGIPIHVWVSETRPRNQGAALTAWELAQEKVPHTVVVDNACGHLIQRGLVDLVLVGSDRTTYTGDVANKIGTYLKALAAKEHHIPFYVALPSSSIDWKMRGGIKEIPIEERNPDEVKYVWGFASGRGEKVLLTPQKSPAQNFAFDVTPRALLSGLITERGICEASEEGILSLFSEKRSVLPEKTDEGYIKFRCRWIRTKPIPEREIVEINRWRNQLHQRGLIGVYSNGIGFGNVSIRNGTRGLFLISGTRTGHLPVLTGAHYTRVMDYDLKTNFLTCRGPAKASSESLTHAALYDVGTEIGAIIHVHHRKLWETLKDKVPTSGANVPYGTCEMAEEVGRLFHAGAFRKEKILVMAGHKEGVMTFGKSLNEAAEILFRYLA